MYENDNFDELKRIYNEVNNSFTESAIFRVGESQGLHSEIDGMMQCMLWCYHRKIKFILYADDANFCGGHGWNEFFDSFCEENHDSLNVKYNRRHATNWKHQLLRFREKLFKKKYNAKYLTQDIFFPCIYEDSKTADTVVWEEFGVNGRALEEFGKMASIAMHYNKKTQQAIEEKISSLNLPSHYFAIQFRGGDKLLEVDRLMNTKDVINQIDALNIDIDNLFIFTDDYRYIDEVKKLKPQWNIYTLTRPDECGYVNEDFQKTEWKFKKAEMIKLFAMIEVCLHSDLYLGCEYSCTNNFIQSVKPKDEYVCVFEHPLKDTWEPNKEYLKNR